MEHEEELVSSTTKATLVIGALVSVWIIRRHALKVRKEALVQRRKIQDWTEQSQSAIRAFENRMNAIIKDPNSTAADFWKAWKEESDFLNLITEQPMY